MFCARETTAGGRESYTFKIVVARYFGGKKVGPMDSMLAKAPAKKAASPKKASSAKKRTADESDKAPKKRKTN